MAFKKYAVNGRGRIGGVTATIGYKGRISLSVGCNELIGDNTAVVCYYDEDEKIICFQLCDSNDVETRAIFKSNGYNNISAKYFLDAIGYDWKTTRKYRVVKSEFEGQPCLLIDLKQPL